jgi:CheY-like chemotaxis protein
MERLLRRVLGEHVELQTALEPGICTVIADRAQLEQVLVNLVINARDAMPSGGHLSIETRNVKVGLPDSDRVFRRAEVEPGEYVMLAVSDSGVGIASDALPHLFEPFFTTKAQGKGTGLGLATCYGIVQQAGGEILVDTEVGIGTKFTILLPRATERAEPVKRRSNASLGMGTETVLFVEDDPGVRRIGVQILAEQSYRIRVAANGIEALQAVASHPGPVHLLVTDVVMPGMSGTELARQLRAQWPGLPVLYISGFTEDATVAESALLPRTAFLPKPYKREALLDKIRDLLGDA